MPNSEKIILMKMSPNIIRPILLAGAMASALLVGCSTTSYTYQDAPQTPVKFESLQAEQTFYDAVLAKYYPAPKSPDGKGFDSDLYLPLSIEHDVRKTSHVLFNEAVAAADTNHDGVITEAEAKTYAAAIAARTDKQIEDDQDSTGW